MRLRAELRCAKALLFDFDGPVCRLMPPPVNAYVNRLVAQAALKAGVRLPDRLEEGTDPLAIVRFVGRHFQERLFLVEAALTLAEGAAAKRAEPAVGITEVFEAITVEERMLAVVTNNSPHAVEVFWQRNFKSRTLPIIFGRVPLSPHLLKPEPYSLLAALFALGVSGEDAVMIGDQVNDVVAARGAGVATSVGVAKDAKRGAELASAGASLVISSLSELLVPTG